MGKEKPIEGIILEALPSLTFKVKTGEGEEVLAYWPDGEYPFI